MTMIRNMTVILGLLVLIYACNAKKSYEDIQQYNKDECDELQGSQYEDCLTDLNLESYNSYKRVLDQTSE